jgi:Domain of unknown function (DUF4193)
MPKDDLDDILDDQADLPEDLDEEDLEDLDEEEEVIDDEAIIDDDDEAIIDDDDEAIIDDDIETEDLEDEVVVPETKVVREDEDEDEEEEDEDSDDVEASLDVILKERLVVVDDDDDDDDEEEVGDPDERGDSQIRVLPKQPGEFVCQSCFLVKHPSQLADEARMLCRDCV